MFGSQYTDIHCGMRGITRDALERMEMSSQGWEYASEMVLKSVHMKLRTTEVPIDFLKDPEGRISHMKRRGWMEPWRAGWMNLRAMLTYGVDFFLIKPGAALLLLGLLFLAPLTFGPFSIGVLSFSLNTMLLAMVLATLGVSMLYSGMIASVLFDYSDTRQPWFDRVFAFNRTVATCLVVGLIGVLLAVPLVRTFVANGLSLQGLGIQTHYAVAGLWLITTSFQTFIFMLMIRALGVVLPKRAQATMPARRGELENRFVRLSTERL